MEFNGATFTFSGVEELESIPKFLSTTQDVNIPEKGKYLAVYFTFQGDEGNQVRNLDRDYETIFELTDRQGNAYYMYFDITAYAANDLAKIREGVENPTLINWSDPEVRNSLLLFDVNASSDGFSLQFMQQEASGESVPVAAVDLGI